METIVRDPVSGRRAVISYDFGSSISEMIEKFGEETVYKSALRTMQFFLAQAVRVQLKKGVPTEDIQERFTNEWTPYHGLRKKPRELSEELLAEIDKQLGDDL